MKFRLVFNTTTEKGNDVVLKFNVPPSKVQGLVNFLNIALNHGNEVNFSIEKISKDSRETSKVRGDFELYEEE